MPDQKVSSIFSWWNTSLDPIRGKNNTSSTIVRETIRDLCTYCDIVILGEYTNKHGLENELKKLNFAFKGYSKEMRIIDLNSQSGRTKFKNLIIYNSSLYSLLPVDGYNNIDFFNFESGYYRNRYRVGQKVRFQCLALDKPIDFYIIHWGMYGEQQGEEKKKSAAITLWHDISKYKENHQICIGDFNTEPYSEALSCLAASRSIEYVKKHGGFFNPFWREIHHKGTINSPNHDSIKCINPMFDQILISQSFLNTTNTSLETGILNDDFDAKQGEHWPIYIKFDIIIQQGEEQNV